MLQEEKVATVLDDDHTFSGMPKLSIQGQESPNNYVELASAGPSLKEKITVEEKLETPLKDVQIILEEENSSGGNLFAYKGPFLPLFHQKEKVVEDEQNNPEQEVDQNIEDNNNADYTTVKRRGKCHKPKPRALTPFPVSRAQKELPPLLSQPLLLPKQGPKPAKNLWQLIGRPLLSSTKLFPENSQARDQSPTILKQMNNLDFVQTVVEEESIDNINIKKDKGKGEGMKKEKSNDKKPRSSCSKRKLNETFRREPNLSESSSKFCLADLIETESSVNGKKNKYFFSDKQVK